MTDKLSILNKRLKEVKEKFDELKKSGIDEKILMVYIQHETGFSMRDVKRFLEAEEEFYKRLVAKMSAEKV